MSVLVRACQCLSFLVVLCPYLVRSCRSLSVLIRACHCLSGLVCPGQSLSAGLLLYYDYIPRFDLFFILHFSRALQNHTPKKKNDFSIPFFFSEEFLHGAQQYTQITPLEVEILFQVANMHDYTGYVRHGKSLAWLLHAFCFYVSFGQGALGVRLSVFRCVLASL